MPGRLRRARQLGQVRFAKVREQQLQHLELGRRHAGQVDQRLGAQRGQPRLEGGRAHEVARRLAVGKAVDRLHVDVEHVELLARRRAVRARVRGVGREQRMQRVEPDDVRALRGHERDQLVEVAEVADAPVARRAQAVQLHRRAPHAPAFAHGRRAGSNGPGVASTSVSPGRPSMCRRW
jgi:hypothetical protein